MPVVHQNVRAAARRQCRTVLLRQTPRPVLGSLPQVGRTCRDPRATERRRSEGRERARSSRAASRPRPHPREGARWTRSARSCARSSTPCDPSPHGGASPRARVSAREGRRLPRSFPENSPGRVARYCLNLDALDLVERDLVARAVVELGDARAFVLIEQGLFGADECADPVAVRWAAQGLLGDALARGVKPNP
jgi:hypothetical protein